MTNRKCNECGQLVEAEDEKSVKKKLRAHYIGKTDHEYDKQKFEDSYFSDQDQELEEEPEIEEDEEQEETEKSQEDDQEEEEEDELLEVDGGMETKSLDDLVEEADEESDEDGDEDSSSSRKGLDTAINKGWGRILTADLDPEEEETSNIRKNLQGLAEDVGLGENAKHYYEEEIKGGETDPKSELMGSLILAVALSLSVRPDLGQKIMNKAKEQREEE